MEPERSLQQSQMPAICSHPEPNQSSQCPLYHFLKMINIILSSTHRSPSKTPYSPCDPPHVQHAPPISFFLLFLLYIYIYLYMCLMISYLSRKPKYVVYIKNFQKSFDVHINHMHWICRHWVPSRTTRCFVQNELLVLPSLGKETSCST
jgi:hypothetical protein